MDYFLIVLFFFKFLTNDLFNNIIYKLIVKALHISQGNKLTITEFVHYNDLE